jgi:hypothetical protein
MTEEANVWEMPEETRDEVIDKISALAWEIRSDWSDPRGECRQIVSLCEKLRKMEK